MYETKPHDFLTAPQAKDSGQRTTVYKRDPSKQYGLKMKTSRMFFSEVERRFDAMPFTLRYNTASCQSVLDINANFRLEFV